MDPELVWTTFPFASLNLLTIGDVVTVAPSLKELDPKIRPSTELSELTFHCFSVGITASASFVFIGLVLCVTRRDALVTLLGTPLFVRPLALKNPLKKELLAGDDLLPKDVSFLVFMSSDCEGTTVLLSAP